MSRAIDVVGKGKEDKKVILQCMKFPQFIDIFDNDEGEKELVASEWSGDGHEGFKEHVDVGGGNTSQGAPARLGEASGSGEGDGGGDQSRGQDVGGGGQ